MNDFFVRVLGIASKKSEKQLSHKLEFSFAHDNSCLMFLDYSNFDIPFGQKFFYFIEARGPEEIFTINAEIKMISQEFGLLYERIPRGHRTICEILVDKQSYELLKARTPVIDYWEILDGVYLLADTGNKFWHKYF